MTKIIAFAGRKQSGKTTCAEYLVDFYSKTLPNSTVKIYNFASPLKEDICKNVLGLTHEQCYGSDDQKNELTNNYWENKQLTAREVMEFIGTNIFRKMQTNVWVDATMKKIQTDNLDFAIIADCRFPNEVKAIKDAGGLVIKLMRNPFNSSHESETSLDPNNFDHKQFDLILMNNLLTVSEQRFGIVKFLHKQGILPL